MSDEWFDVVDAADCVIGRELRANVHRLGLRHRAVHALVFDAHGRVFLQKRSLSKDTWPGAWDSSASGHLACGEDYDVCAIRELQEELGWTPTTETLRRILRLEACVETGQEFVWVYRVRWDGRPFELNAEEIETGAWLSPDEVDARVKREPETFALSFRHIWWRLRSEGVG